MPRPAKGPYLYLVRKAGRRSYWIIREAGQDDVGTGCFGPDCGPDAQQALAEHIASRHRPSIQGRATLVADVLVMYFNDRAKGSRSEDLARIHIAALKGFWADKTIEDVCGRTCRAYVTRRTKDRVKAATKIVRLISASTARRELVTLGAALRFAHKEHGVPLALVTLPEEPAPRDRWLTRDEAARMLRAARLRGFAHIERFIRLGLYTGTRHDAMLALQWYPNTTGGWVDLAAGLLYRRGQGEAETKKRRPTSRLHRRLIPLLKRWKAEDEALFARLKAKAIEAGREPPPAIRHIVHWKGEQIAKERRAWAIVVKDADLGPDVTPHVLRHTAITWAIQRGVTIEEAAPYFGCSPKTLERVYWHHSPDFQKRAAGG